MARKLGEKEEPDDPGHGPYGSNPAKPEQDKPGEPVVQGPVARLLPQ